MLLSRLPLTPKGPFDLHVLRTPPAFVLSQDQTLRQIDLQECSSRAPLKLIYVGSLLTTLRLLRLMEEADKKALAPIPSEGNDARDSSHPIGKVPAPGAAASSSPCPRSYQRAPRPVKGASPPLSSGSLVRPGGQGSGSLPAPPMAVKGGR